MFGRAEATGLSGGAGADTVTNEFAVEANAVGRATATRVAVTFAGSASNAAVVAGHADATGMDGGAGADTLRNDGTIAVNAQAFAVGSGGAKTTFGGTSASSLIGADSSATGIAAGGGADDVANTGTLTVGATTDAQASNSSDSGWLFGDAQTRADVAGAATAVGLTAGAGNASLTNDGNVAVAATGIGFGFSYASGAHLTFDSNGLSIATSQAAATAAGFVAGGGDNIVTNNGTMNVSAVAKTSKPLELSLGSFCTQEQKPETVCHEEVDEEGNKTEVCEVVQKLVTTCEPFTLRLGMLSTHAVANGNGLDGDGTATATADGTAEAVGVRAGDGANRIVNTGTLAVGARPEPAAAVFVDGDAWGDAVGYTRATSTASAVGITAGNGGNAVQNDGRLIVIAEPLASAHTQVSGGDICIWYLFGTWCGGGGAGVGTAMTEFTARAVGINTGSGSDTVINNGELLVRAAPSAASAPSVVVDADSARALTTVVSTAVGIDTGTGNDTIVNAGTITVEARDLAVPYGCLEPVCSTVTAAGILAGDGDDQITQDGSLTVWTAKGDVTHLGVAIDAGAGNDVLALGSGSTTSGSITLGAGDDALVLSAGATTSSGVDAAAGRDTFALGGSVDGSFDVRDFNTTFLHFEEYRKQGPSRWTLPRDDTRDWTIVGGTLVVPGTMTATFTAAGGELAITDTGTVQRHDGLSPVVLLGGTLTNAGLLEATGTAVDATGDHNVVNNSGTIDGSAVGLSIAGDASTVTNGGTITSSGTAAVVAGDHNVVNNSGTIDGSAIGISIAGDASTVTNGGTITSSGTAAIVAGDHNGVTNAGRLDGSVTGLLIEGHGNAITNSGTIVSSGSALEVTGSGNVVSNAGAVQGVSGALITGNDNVVSNSGTIDAAAVAVEATGSGTGLDNSGSIHGGDAGVVVDGRDNGVANSGTIESAGIAVDVVGTGTVVDNAGLIQGATAVVLSGGANTLTNSGRIEGGSNGPAVQVAGTQNAVINDGLVHGNRVGLEIAGDGNAVSNSGAIASSGVSVHVVGGGNSLDNAGTIEAGGNGAALRVNGTANEVSNTGRVSGARFGVDVGGDRNRLINAGRIESGSSAVVIDGNDNAFVNAGDISAGAESPAIEIAGNANALSNYGLIGGSDIGVRVGGRNAVIVNEAAIDGISAGLALAGDAHELTNRGTVEATGPAVWFQTDAGSSAWLQNDGGGVLRSLGAPAVLGGDGREHVVNEGSLVGGAGTAIDLGGGDDVLTLTTTSAIEGLSRGGSGLDTLVLAGTGRARAHLGDFAGFEGLSKEDTSRWLVSGASDVPWTVRQGELAVEGTLAGPGSVESAGRLSGSGAVGSFVNAGTVAPGFSLGTLRGLGDYEHANGAVLEIDGTPVNGVSDHLDIAGHAVLDGGSVAVSSGATQYGIATEHTIVRAAGGVEGRFEGVSVSDAGNLDAALEYSPQAVTLVLTRNDISFQAMGDGRNLQGFGGAMDASKRAMARGDFKSLMDGFVGLDEAQQQAALESLTGEVHATVARSLVHTGMRFFSAEVNRQLSARQVRSDMRVFWADAFGFTGIVHDDGNASAADYRAAGFAAGVDVMVTGATRVGLGVGLSPGRTELRRANGGVARTRSYQPALYAEHTGAFWDVAAGIGYGRHQVDTSRRVQVASNSSLATASYAADQYSALVRGAFEVTRVRAASVKAFSEVRYSTLRRGGFAEEGAGSASLADVRRARIDSLQLQAGIHTQWTPDAWRGRLRPDIKLGWSRESLDDRGLLRAALSGATLVGGRRTFSVFGPAESRNSAILGFGLSTGMGTNMDAFITYDGRLSDSGSEHGLAAGGRLQW